MIPIIRKKVTRPNREARIVGLRYLNESRDALCHQLHGHTLSYEQKGAVEYEIDQITQVILYLEGRN